MTSPPLRPRSSTPVSSADVAVRCGARHDAAAVTLSGITNRSGEVRPGDLYAGVPGSRVHGAQYAADAVAAGARAVLTDPGGAQVCADLGVPVLVSDDVRAALGPASALIYGDPAEKLTMLGITATSGKTTTAYLIRAILQDAGIISGLLGTVETIIGDEHIAHTAGSSFTTPEAPDLQALLAVMLERGVTHVVMEVSSHSLQLGRVGAIRYAVAGFGNLTQDHLDFHGSMDEYFQAKARLFDERTATAVLNIDDPWVARLRQQRRDAVTVCRSGHGADWQISGDPVTSPISTEFVARGPGGINVPVRLSLPGEFNIDNALMALAITSAAGIDPMLAAGSLQRVHVPGRMERVDAGQDFVALVDYSHKPAAVEAALRSVRQQTDGRVLIVLGCGGDRDAAKRPIMGEVAARDADVLVITDDNPRSEDPALIRAAMRAGAEQVPADQRGEVVDIGDRAEAIRHAVAAAEPGDVVLVAGKGHEVGQYVAGVVHDFDDRIELRRAIEDRA